MSGYRANLSCAHEAAATITSSPVRCWTVVRDPADSSALSTLRGRLGAQLSLSWIDLSRGKARGAVRGQRKGNRYLLFLQDMRRRVCNQERENLRSMPKTKVILHRSSFPPSGMRPYDMSYDMIAEKTGCKIPLSPIKRLVGGRRVSSLASRAYIVKISCSVKWWRATAQSQLGSEEAADVKFVAPQFA